VGKQSKRIRDNYVFRDILFDIDWNKTDQIEPKSLDIKLKNTCNLACRICNATNSSKWVNEIKRNPSVYQNSQADIVNFDWRTDLFEQKLYSDFFLIAKKVNYINLSGGEPFLDKNHVALLEHFINFNSSQDIHLHYNTNGTIYADRLIPYWNQFGTVELSFSIDNTGTKFDYERYGSQWNTVPRVIEQYQQLSNQRFKFNVYSTVSVLNILDLYELYQWANSLNLPIVFNILQAPLAISIGAFTQGQKKYVNTKFNSIIDEKFAKLITPVLNYINETTTTSPITVEQFLEPTDRVRQQNFKTTYPELTDLLSI
jgi:MoaA/NifB/PqqE/SkfB family radical SAM enzyme